ncbi:hypothetical protein H4S01_006890, partial [Coemansia sp. RSA 2610]
LQLGPLFCATCLRHGIYDIGHWVDAGVPYGQQRYYIYYRQWCQGQPRRCHRHPNHSRHTNFL